MQSSALWQVSVTTSVDAEESVVALLNRLFNESVSAFTDEETRRTVVSVYPYKLTAAGRRIRRELLAGLQEIRACGVNARPGKITIRRVRRTDWAESWKRQFRPFEIARALLIKPSWSRRKPRRNQAVVVLNPGLSFGTGHHPTTSFCLEQLVAARRRPQPQSFLDIGTGSGILAVAAAKLGYNPIEAFDFDPVSVRVAKANARQNGASALIKFSRRDLRRLPTRSRSKFDVVCANLTFDLLLDHRARITHRMTRRGRLILAGILTSQFAQVQEAYTGLGLRPVANHRHREWQSLALVHAD